MQRLAAKMERERLLQHALPDLSRRIVEHAREHGRVTIREMTLLTGTSRNTLKEHFQRLLENGMLERNGQGRGVCGTGSSSVNRRARPDSSKEDVAPFLYATPLPPR